MIRSVDLNVSVLLNGIECSGYRRELIDTIFQHRSSLPDIDSKFDLWLVVQIEILVTFEITLNRIA